MQPMYYGVHLICRTVTLPLFSRRFRGLAFHLTPLLCFLALGLPTPEAQGAASPVLISEFMASDDSPIRDEDDDRSDWIELQNVSSAPWSLEGWSLTDESNNPRKWVFPAVQIPAGGFMLVYASGKDRAYPDAPLHTNFKLSNNGEYLALFQADGTTPATEFSPGYPPQLNGISYGFSQQIQRSLWVTQGTPLFYLVPTSSNPTASWNATTFSVVGWGGGRLGIGYDRSPSPAPFTSLITTDVNALMYNKNSSLYLRIPFNVSSRSDLRSLLMRVRYNDGFVAYLNGQQVASRNAAEVPAWNSTSETPRTPAASLATETIDLGGSADFLQVGLNVLAVHVMNTTASSSNLLFTAELEGQFGAQNAASARYFNPPTPGALNGTGTLVVGPRIENIRHTPETPADTEALLVTARVLPTVKSIQSVRMEYQVMFRTVSTLTMFDDGQHGDGAAGDGVYGATIPASAYGQGEMIRYAIIAQDSAATTTRDPAYADPLNSPQYHGTVAVDGRFQSKLDTLHWFLLNPNDARGWGGTRCSIYFRGQFRDNILVNLHGQSSSGFPKNSFDFDLNPGHSLTWDPDAPTVDDFNLLTTYPDKAHLRNIIAYETFRDAGSPYHFVVPVRVQQNAQFWGDAHFVENGDANYLKRLGLDTRGALYKMYNLLDAAEGEKKTRKDENNADLQALIDGCRLTGDARKRFLFDQVNVSEVINFLAATIIIGNTDCCHKNYYVYRDTEGTGEWQMLPWDVDLSFGRVWSCSNPCLTYWDDTMHPDTGLYVGNGNTLGTAIFSTPETKQMYLRRVRTLADELLQPGSTPLAERRYENRIDELASLLAPDAAADLAKWGTWGNGSASSACCVQSLPQAAQLIKSGYLDPRRKFLLQNQLVTNGGEIPLAQGPDASPDFARMDFNPASGNQGQEFVELKNNGTAALDISGWRVEGAIRHVFIGGSVIPARASLFLSPEPRSFRSRTVSPKGNEGLLVQGPYRGQLSARGETLRLYHKDGRLMRTLTYPGNPSAAQNQLRITEIMYHPLDSDPPNPARTASDYEFIELQNVGNSPLNLSGIHFTNGLRFQFSGSAITNLNPGQFALIVRNLAAFQSRYGTSLPVAGTFLGSLGNGGERLSLHDAAGEVILDFAFRDKPYPISDGLGFSLVIRDPLSSHDQWDLSSAWRASSRIHGSPGAIDPTPVASPGIVINEILTHTDPPQLDSVELHNPGSEVANLEGWWLTDDFKTPRKYRLPAGSSILPGGFLTLDERQFNPTTGQGTSFSLSSTGEEIWLFAVDGAGQLTGSYQGLEYGASQNGISFGRYVNSQGEVFYPAQTSNSLGSTNPGPLVGPVVISEIHYHPLDNLGQYDPSLEYVELSNNTTTNVALYDLGSTSNTWRIRGGIRFDFPAGVMLQPGAPLLLVQFAPTNQAALTRLRTQYGLAASTPIFGPYTGRLDNAGDAVRLYKPDPPNTNLVPYILVDEVRYRTNAPWPTAAAQGIASLQRRWDNAFANDPTNWFAAGKTPGAPNIPNQAPVAVWTSPAPGTSFISPPSIRLQASASDSDGTISRVEFWADGTLLGSDNDAPYEWTWVSPPGGVHTLYARAVDNRNATGTSSTVEILVGQPPTIQIVLPAPETLAVNSAPLPLSAEATDADGSVAKVQFLIDGNLISESLSVPYTSEWPAPVSGIHFVSAIAVDNLGLTSTSSVHRVIVGDGVVKTNSLISQGAVWSYHDLGQDLGTQWRLPTDSDENWKSGPAQLGYGDGDEATVVSFGPDANSKYPTVYFRKKFVITDPSLITALELRLLRDDGAVVYLNTNEVMRSAMPPGDILYTTPASATATGPEETTQFFTTSIKSSLLKPGTNIVAVEVHQAALSSSDLSFDLELSAQEQSIKPIILTQPNDADVAAGADVVFSAEVAGSPALRLQWYRGTPPKPLPGANSSQLRLRGVVLADSQPYLLIASNSVGVAQSRIATLRVTSSDSDQDGMPDDWERSVGLNPSRNDAAEDKDGDGKTNLEEWIAGTHPSEASSVLRLQSIQMQGQDRVIEFAAVSNRTYTVVVSPIIAPATWTKVSEITPAPTNRVVRVIDSVTRPSPQFYRLEVK